MKFILSPLTAAVLIPTLYFSGAAFAQTEGAFADIKEAGDRKDPGPLRFAADINLILVNGLEMFFNSRTKVVDIIRRGTSATETRDVAAPP